MPSPDGVLTDFFFFLLTFSCDFLFYTTPGQKPHISPFMFFLQDNNDGSFGHDALYSTGSNSPQYVITGDFNKDNRLDFVVVNPDGNNIGVFLGYDTGKFNALSEFSTSYGSLPSSLTFGDFNHDNQLDMAVSNYGSNNIGVFFGNGNATFTMDTTYFTGFTSQPRMIVSADFNDDNIMDIATANLGIDSIGVLLGYKNGSFGSQQVYSTNLNSTPQALAVGDFNDDNRSDLVVANFGTDNIGVLLGYDTVKFLRQIYFPPSGSFTLTSIAIGDFNNDNRSDIVASSADTSSVFIFLGYGNGTFASQMAFSTDSKSYLNFVAVADFNNDNRLDIVVTNYGANNVLVLLGYGNGTFGSQMKYSTGDGSYPTYMAVADFNSDNRLDIVVANYGAENVVVLLGYGNGTFASQMTYSTGSGSRPNCVAIGDFNNDNQMDIIVLYYGTGYVGVFSGYGNGTFGSPQRTYVGSADYLKASVTVGDFNNDNRLDFAIGNRYNNFVGLFLGYGNGAFTNQYQTWDSQFFNPGFVAAGDFNNDSLLDLAVLDDYRLYAFLGSSVKGFLDIKTFSTGSGSLPNSVSVGDFNNDDQMDIVVANSGSDNVGILLGLGYGLFANQTTYATGHGSMPYSVAVGDFNNDSRLDIGVANYGTGNVGILLGYGDGSFAAPSTYLTDPTSYPSWVVINDLNNDNRLNIVVVSLGSNSVTVVFGVGDGSFFNQTKVLMGYGAQPIFAAVADVDNDKWLDIAVINYASGNIEILSKTC